MNNIEQMEARIAICEGKARYCRFLDTKQWDAFMNLMTEDFTLDVSEGTQIPVIRGRDAAIERIRASIGTAVTAHQVHQPEIDFESDDEAAVIWPMQDRVMWAADKPSLTGYGHYHERWVRRDGEWKLAASRLTRLHIDFLPPRQG